MAHNQQIGTALRISNRLVAVKDLTLNPENERIYNADEPRMVSLRQSIASEGILAALEIYDDGVVHDGNRRLSCLQHLIAGGSKIGPVPTVIVARPTDAAEAVLARLNRNEAEQFSPLEQGIAFAKLRANEMNNTQIAARTPFSSMHVGNMLTLHDASESVRNFVAAGSVSATLAVETVRKHGEDVLAQAIALAESQDKDKATQRHVDAVANPAKEADVGPVADADANVAEAEVEAEVEASAEADNSCPFDLDDTAPTGATVAAEEDVLPPTTTAVAEPATAAPAITAKALVQMLAPTLQTLIEVMESGTVSEKIEAFEENLPSFQMLVAQAKKLGLLAE